MKIDIVSYTDEQYAAMTHTQIDEVRQAQKNKDKLTLKLRENLHKEKYALVKRGIYNSSLYDLIKNQLQEDYDAQVEFIRDGLLFFLKYSMDPDGSGLDAPYEVNYAQSFETRMNVVKHYYEVTYLDAHQRFEAFKVDRFALNYLGEYYRMLFAYFEGQDPDSGNSGTIQP